MGTSADLTTAAAAVETDLADLFNTRIPAMRTARDTAYSAAVSAKGANYGVSTVQQSLSDERLFALLVGRMRASVNGQAFLNYLAQHQQGPGASMAPVPDFSVAVSAIAGAAPLLTWLT